MSVAAKRQGARDDAHTMRGVNAREHDAHDWKGLEVVDHLQIDDAANNARARPTRPAWVGAALDKGMESRKRLQLVPGKLIPGTRYRIKRWLGDGGMGSVYEVEHVDVGRAFALKVLHAKVAANEEVTRAFREEAKAAARVPSQYIVQTYDFAELEDGRLLFTMDFLDGHNLGDEVERGPMDLARFIGLARQTSRGLHDAHRAGLIHRDVKPDNIMVLPDQAGRDLIKLLDFGVATMMDDGAVEDAEASGTAHYLAPEVILGGRIDHRVDMYAFGCTAYELLCGHPPFDDDAIENILSDHLTREPPRLTCDGVPEGVAAVVRRCLAKRPEDRFVDMADLEAALCEAQLAAGITTAWDDLPLPSVDGARREALLSLIPDVMPAARSPRRRLGLILASALACAVIGGATSYWAAPPLTAETSVIEALTERSQAAAARAYFVYPPTNDPHADTAYTSVKAMRELGSSAAIARAEELSDAFADTLCRLGDEYWGRPGGKPFSLDYYVQALVFDPERPEAAERAQLTPGQLIALEHKASSLAFTEAELIAASPLAALASANDKERTRRIDELRKAGYEPSPTIDAQLSLLVSPAAARKPAVAPKPSEAPKSAPRPRPQAEEEEVVDEAASPSQGDDRRAAKKHERAGWGAARSGRVDAAQAAFEKALALDPRNTGALDGMAKVHFDLAQYAQAASVAERAVRASPRTAGFRIRLGDAYYKLYRYDDAIEQYQRAQALGHAGAAARLAKAKAKAE